MSEPHAYSLPSPSCTSLTEVLDIDTLHPACTVVLETKSWVVIVEHRAYRLTVEVGILTSDVLHVHRVVRDAVDRVLGTPETSTLVLHHLVHLQAATVDGAALAHHHKAHHVVALLTADGLAAGGELRPFRVTLAGPPTPPLHQICGVGHAHARTLLAALVLEAAFIIRLIDGQAFGQVGAAFVRAGVAEGAVAVEATGHLDAAQVVGVSLRVTLSVSLTAVGAREHLTVSASKGSTWSRQLELES